MKKSILNICIIFMISLLSVFTPEMKSQNPEWMYFHDIKPSWTIAALGNSIYIQTNDEGTHWVIRLNLEDLSIDTIGRHSISSIAMDANGDIWMSTRGKGVMHYKDGIITEYNPQNSGLSHHVVHDIAFDNENNLWCATKNGLSKFDGQEWEVLRTDGSGQLDNEFGQVVIDKDGSTWHLINGSRVYHQMNGEFLRYNSENTGFFNLHLTSKIGIDSKGNKWFVSGIDFVDTLGGLIKYDNASWVEYNNKNSELTSNQLTTLTIDSNDIVWVGSYYNGLSKFDGTTWSNFTPSNSGISGEGVSNICTDRFNNKWMYVYSVLTQEKVGLEVFREGGVLLPTSAKESIERLKNKEPLVIPNPAVDMIRVTDIVMRERKYKITNILGQIVHEGIFYHDIDVSSLSSGFYFLKVDDFYLKFIKK
jgi:hypothetical protein